MSDAKHTPGLDSFRDGVRYPLVIAPDIVNMKVEIDGADRPELILEGDIDVVCRGFRVSTESLTLKKEEGANRWLIPASEVERLILLFQNAEYP